MYTNGYKHIHLCIYVYIRLYTYAGNKIIIHIFCQDNIRNVNYVHVTEFEFNIDIFVCKILFLEIQLCNSTQF